MYKIDIKPLTVNQAFKPINGRFIKSKAYREYEKELWYLLPDKNISKGKLVLFIEVGFSSKLNDIDNVIKPFCDILQKKYLFNDRMIYKLDVEKNIVKKGEEFISFEIRIYKE